LKIYHSYLYLHVFQNPINKDACLGEYTGELITHREAEKRGKLYNRINHSFLFDLNDKASVSFDQIFILT